MLELKTIAAADGVDAIEAELLANGGVIVSNVIETDVLRQFNAEMDPLLEAASAETNVNPVISEFFGSKVRHVSGLAGKSTLFAERIMCHPLYLALCDRILLPNCCLLYTSDAADDVSTV